MLVQYKVDKYKERLRDPSFTTNPLIDNMKAIVKRCDISVEKCSAWFADGAFALAANIASSC